MKKEPGTIDATVRLAAPARRALASAGIESLIELSRHSEAEINALHGMGPKAMQELRDALDAEGLSFRPVSKNTVAKTKQPAGVAGKSEVDRFFDELGHPMKPTMLAIRNLVLAADEGITEQIKWNAPSFVQNGTDKITFNIHRSGKLLLIFHRGAKPKPLAKPGRLIEDPTGLLEWPADDRAVLAIASAEDLEKLGPDLGSLVSKWLYAAK